MVPKILSYIYPVTKKVHSEINGTLEITWYNGKKHLNTKNANYSFGSLQRILKYGLEHIDLSKVQNILLLGLGGGSVIDTLRNDFRFQGEITAVEIDPVIIDIAKDEFGIHQTDRLHIINQDASDFVVTDSAQYNLIIIDLFIDINVPQTFLEILFWRNLIKRLSPNGIIIFNAAVNTSKNTAVDFIIEFLRAHVYALDIHENVNDTNTLIITRGL